MGKLIENARMAFKSILSNKSRSVLTMLGIIIGIASVIAIMIIGGGGQAEMDNQFSVINKGTVTISVDTQKGAVSDRFTLDDIESIKENVDLVLGVTPSVSASGRVFGEREEIAASYTSGTPDIVYSTTAEMLVGRYWSEDDYNEARNVCTIDEVAAREIFGSTDILGLQIEVSISGRNVYLTIIGVTEATAAGFFNSTVTASIHLPMTTLMKYSDSIGQNFTQLTIIAHDKDLAREAGTQALAIIETRHDNRGRELYSLFDMAMFTDEIASVMSMFTTLIAAIAAISLLVGGIGVMNIMMVSVTERTREIGIRKALGAKTGAITLQFLIESGALTLIGGVIGIILGLWAGSAACSAFELPFVVDPMLVVGVTLFSTAIGLFFGIYPARKAAKLNPIEALRSE